MEQVEQVDYKAQLCKLETVVIRQAMEQLESQILAMKSLEPGKRQFLEIEKTVKLCHQVRSLLPVA